MPKLMRSTSRMMRTILTKSKLAGSSTRPGQERLVRRLVFIGRRHVLAAAAALPLLPKAGHK